MVQFMLPDSAADGLDAASEAEWQRFHYQLGLTEAFWLSFLFTPSQATCRVFRQRTENILRARAHRLRIIRPQTPDSLRNALQPLFEQNLEGTQHVWIEALQVDPPLVEDGPWATAWDWFVMRLNERRDRMRRAIGGFVTLAAPPAMKPRIRVAAPDLWSVRAIVLEPPPLAQPPQVSRSALRGAVKDPHRSLSLTMPQNKAPYDGRDPRELLREAKGLHRRGAHREAILHAASAVAVLRNQPTDEPQNRKLLQQALVLQAEAESEMGDNAAAMEHYRAAIFLALQGEPERNALNWFDQLLELLQSAGRRDDVLATSQLSVEHARRLLEVYGESPQALRDVSVSLNKLGDALKEEGDAENAKAAYQESLLIRRRLLEAYGESPQALRDVSVSLDNLGAALKEEGDAENAKAAYQESLLIRRRLLEAYGESPQALLDLEAVFYRLADLDLGKDRLESASAFAEECLQLCRRRMQLYAKTPQICSNLAAELSLAAEISKKIGQDSVAEAYSAERKSILAERDVLLASLPSTS